MSDAISKPYSPPIPLGTMVKPYGKISAICFRDGERYYMLTDKHGDVSLIPADLLEGERG